MAGEILPVGKSSASAKAGTTFSEETEKVISLWSEEVLFNSRQKDYFEKGC